jgi:hypothetical protein
MGDRVPAFEAGEHLRGRVPAVQGVGTIRTDEHARAAALLRQAFEQGDALVVGPVQVVEHHHARCGRGEIVHDLEAQSHPLVGRPAGVDQAREPVVPELVINETRARPERVEQQFEGTAERARIGLSREHDHLGGEPLHQLAHESGLPHAGFATDERDRGTRPGVDETREPCQLVSPAGHQW